ncbi:MAG: S49 family peptidase [Xanthobacteraceae bacterium]
MSEPTPPGRSPESSSGGILDLLRRILPRRLRGGVPLVPVVRLTGIIGFSTPLKPGLTLAGIARALERAFSMRRAKAVALCINSPGGSPVQSHLIFRRIRQLAEEKGLPVLAFIEDAGASGGYMIACAADEIVCDASSMVGSIGVMGGSFGFNKLMEKVGIERRLFTSGERKAMLDPFLPEKPEDVERLKQIQSEIHQDFIALVKERRGTKLTGPEKALFSGEFWTGARAVEIGIADALGDLRSVLRQRYGEDVLMPVVTPERGFFSRRLRGLGLGGLEQFWSRPGFAEEILSALEARALWSRYGL